MNYDLLQELLPLLTDYQRSTTTPSAAGFGAWLQMHAPTLPATPDYATARTAPNEHETVESLLTKLLTFVYRYVRGYARQALADTPLTSSDDFTYLIALYTGGPLTKSDIIARNIHEKATGTEVIKRLLKHGFITEEPHATDRRRKLLRITEAGRGLLFQVLGRMSQVAQMAAGNLTGPERHQLVHLLHKLDAFHYPVFAAHRPGSFPELVAAFFPDSAAGWQPSTLP